MLYEYARLMPCFGDAAMRLRPPSARPEKLSKGSDAEDAAPPGLLTLCASSDSCGEWCNAGLLAAYALLLPLLLSLLLLLLLLLLLKLSPVAVTATCRLCRRGGFGGEPPTDDTGEALRAEELPSTGLSASKAGEI